MTRNLVCGGLLVLVAAAFWIQEDQGAYTEAVDATFPRFVLGALVVLGIAIAVSGALRHRRGDREGREFPGDSEVTGGGTSRFAPWALAAGSVLLLGWGVAFGLFGITLSGVVAFVALTLLVRRGPAAPRQVLVDIGVAVAFVLVCLLLFNRVLAVPLPVSVLVGV